MMAVFLCQHGGLSGANRLEVFLMNNVASTRIHRMAGIAILSAFGFVLMNFAVPIIPAFPFLKLDGSDVPVLIGALLYGPVGGVGVAFIRSLVHFVLTGGGAVNLVGDVAAFLASCALVIPVGLTVRKQFSWRRLVTGLVLGVVLLTVVMSIMNYFVLIPVYMAVLNFKLGVSLAQYIVIGVVPFNLIKGVLLAVITAVVARPLNGWIQHNRHDSTVVR
ncbi:membrane protein [Lacticaseibacillus thailandensis DSM 22698 = JCM 13996]|uniref:Riboflavin transporter n=2 Tax=Lacticaseibacillus thailandensis TaxID=381741 RepID=A0A0R2CIH4_9LACO|nr:membrane protein [Lacticaseibacillus thailandensis DSM 22698 = JCM 13996]